MNPTCRFDNSGVIIVIKEGKVGKHWFLTCLQYKTRSGEVSVRHSKTVYVYVLLSTGVRLSPGNVKACIANTLDCVKPFVCSKASARDFDCYIWHDTQYIFGSFLSIIDAKGEIYMPSKAENFISNTLVLRQ